MSAQRILPHLMLALLTATAMTLPVLPVHAQMLRGQSSGQVGQPPLDPNATLAPPAAPAQGPVLPTLDDEIRAAEARRRAREQARAVTSAGNPVLDPRTRGQVLRPVRGIVQLRRPANRAVPLRQGAANPAGPIPAQQALPQVIAPGLSDPAARRARRPEQIDPYDPIGLRLGTLIVRPGIEANIGYDTNPERSTGTKPKGSKVVQGAADLSVRSDWSRHQLQFDLRGTYNYYPDVKNADRPQLNANLTFRGDIAEQGTLNLELRERIDSQRPGSPDLTSSVKGRPLTFQTGASAGYTQKFGRASLTGTALVDRFDFEDGKTTSGIKVPQGDREMTQYGLKLRGGYEVTPGIQPFIEVGADRRTYDQAIDSGGYKRSSVGYTLRAGSTFEITRTLTGEVAAGYGFRDYEDTRLGDLKGPLVDASLVWQASPLTRVTLKAGTEFLETTQAGSAGALGHRVGLLVTHDLLRNLQIGLNFDYSHASYSGISRTEQTVVAGARIDYKIDRNFVFRTSYSYERAISSIANNSSTAHVFLAGIRLQH